VRKVTKLTRDHRTNLFDDLSSNLHELTQRAAELSRDHRKPFWSQYDERNDEDDENLGRVKASHVESLQVGSLDF
jgi:hypothetical protein